MMVRTTQEICDKQIELNFISSQECFDEFNKKEWVCLEDLKKQIEKLNNIEILQDKYVVGDYVSAYIDGLNDILELCKSPEQVKGSAVATSDVNPLVNLVSGEQAGEDESRNDNKETLSSCTSSPVQNPKFDCDCSCHKTKRCGRCGGAL